MVSTEKRDGEGNDSLVRRFRRKLRSSGHLKNARKNKRRQRPMSKLQKKRKRQRSDAKKAEIEFLRITGKLDEDDYRNRRRR